MGVRTIYVLPPLKQMRVGQLPELCESFCLRPRELDTRTGPSWEGHGWWQWTVASAKFVGGFLAGCVSAMRPDLGSGCYQMFPVSAWVKKG